MSILSYEGVNFLVIFGGASPEQGPLGDVIYAQLPNPDMIGEPQCFNFKRIECFHFIYI
jgi:hypothetical protein